MSFLGHLGGFVGGVATGQVGTNSVTTYFDILNTTILTFGDTTVGHFRSADVPPLIGWRINKVKLVLRKNRIVNNQDSDISILIQDVTSSLNSRDISASLQDLYPKVDHSSDWDPIGPAGLVGGLDAWEREWDIRQTNNFQNTVRIAIDWQIAKNLIYGSFQITRVAGG